MVPARLVGQRVATGGKWEGLFCASSLMMLGNTGETRGRPTPGEHVVVGEGLDLVLEGRGEGDPGLSGRSGEGKTTSPLWRSRTARPDSVTSVYPAWVRSPRDRVTYQTIYARRPGSVAAPTAGLHFTDEVFGRLATRGIIWVDLTLHVGLGTFRPIEVERIENHVMHAEWVELSTDAIDILNLRRREGGRIVAIGTTAARGLETAAAGETLASFSGETDIFIQPGHVFRGLDALVTNFHLPRSSLLVLVMPLAGLELIRAAYDEAIRRQYRFFSYGDAMLIL